MSQASVIAPTDSAPTHPKLVILGHWLSFALLLVVFALVLPREWIDDKVTRTVLLQAHRVAGLLIGCITIFRLGMRTRLPLVEGSPALARWQHWASRLSQVAMYLMLLSLPVLGWLLTNARGQPVVVPWLGSLPVLMDRDLDLADTLEMVHTWTAWILVSMVALHASAAVWHHRVRRDDVLRAMWPGLRARS
jgi:cytochrome b561